MKRVVMIDNYDSFTYNLVQYVKESSKLTVEVIKNDQVDLSTLTSFDAMILSPGPGLPAESGQLMDILRLETGIPTLGICLGHQAIGLCYGASLQQLEKVYHGVSSPIEISTSGNALFYDIPSPFIAGRYHSWVIDKESLEGTALEITCRDEAGWVMGIKHRSKEIYGVQFHPESVMTQEGRKMINNFIQGI